MGRAGRCGQKTNPGINVLKRLARALGVPVTELLT